MFKKTALILISFYQNTLSYAIKSIAGVSNTCRYEITCSEYAKKAIEKYGVIDGSIKSIKRVLSCQPFYHGNI